MWLDNFRIEKGGDEAWSSSESGFSVRKSGRPVSSKGTGRRLVWNRLGRIMDISFQKSNYLSG